MFALAKVLLEFLDPTKPDRGKEDVTPAILLSRLSALAIMNITNLPWPQCLVRDLFWAGLALHSQADEPGTFATSIYLRNSIYLGVRYSYVSSEMA